MKLSTRLDHWHEKVRNNIWLYYFAIFCRIALAIGFIPPGLQKVLGERFTVLSSNLPMGHFLEAFYHTGYYYSFIGFMQILAGVLLLIPRTVTLGAFIYLPIILNICILSLALRFEGSIITAPLMVFAVLYLLCWDYHKFKYIFPFNHVSSQNLVPKKGDMNSVFPFRFFLGVLFVCCLTMIHPFVAYKIMPRNNLSDCQSQCQGDASCNNFCTCIHEEGHALKTCIQIHVRQNGK